MRLFAAPRGLLQDAQRQDRQVGLFARKTDDLDVAVGGAIANALTRRKLLPPRAAVDFLAIALSTVAADGMVARRTSPDGWTREFDLSVALQDPDAWVPLQAAVSDAVRFLTTDRWNYQFEGEGYAVPIPSKPTYLACDSAVLRSGGLDSLVGVIDLAARGLSPVAVSKTDRGAARKQCDFTRLSPGTQLEHLQLNDNVSTSRSQKETSQRSRSLLFIALGVLGATTTEAYEGGATVPLYVCENGFIAINPPLTGSRIGSLSTRTTHPEFLGRVQAILSAVGLRVDIRNPYAERTKGEMLAECADQDILAAHAKDSISCGRFQRFNYTHCGRCVPCQIRRAAFLKWSHDDPTEYRFADLSIADPDFRHFKDVRAVQMAYGMVEMSGFDTWLGATLRFPYASQGPALRAMLERGLDELRAIHADLGVL